MFISATLIDIMYRELLGEEVLAATELEGYCLLSWTKVLRMGPQHAPTPKTTLGEARQLSHTTYLPLPYSFLEKFINFPR